jgi:uncharacterized protein
MKPCFADTLFFYALLNGADRWHAQALKMHASRRPVVTTDFVLLELADGLCDVRNREVFVQFSAFLAGHRTTEIIPVTADLLRRGRESYAARPDKEWSLTDCTSFVVMSDRKIADALTGDHHFEQAGFNALLK